MTMPRPRVSFRDTRRNCSKAAHSLALSRHGRRPSHISKVTITEYVGTRPWVIRVRRTLSELIIKEQRLQIASAATTGQGLRKQRLLLRKTPLPLTDVSLRLNNQEEL